MAAESTLAVRARRLLRALEDALPACTRCHGLGFVTYPAGYPGKNDVLRDVPCDAGGCPYVALAGLGLLIDEAGAALDTIALLAGPARPPAGRGEGVADGS